MNLLKPLVGIFASKDAQLDDLRTNDLETVEFRLLYGNVTIAYISHSNGEWTLRYSDEFKRQTELVPLREFPDKNITYTSDEPWPFLLARLPSTRRPDVQVFLRRKQIDPSNIVVLLKEFGRHSVSSPFDLVA